MLFDLAPPRAPPPLVSKLSIFPYLPVCRRSSLLTGERGGGEEKAWSSMNHSILFDGDGNWGDRDTIKTYEILCEFFSVPDVQCCSSFKQTHQKIYIYKGGPGVCCWSCFKGTVS
jgi:hypothetical protein